MGSEPSAVTERRGWGQALRVYAQWPVVALFFLGFSSGLPYLLIFSTLSARLADVGVNTATIGFFSWLGITYSIKVLWAPVIDQLRLPLIHRLLGQRRGWLVLAQLGIALGLWKMAHIEARLDTGDLALWGLLVAFSSATQDISIDAYRIEIAGERLQAAMSAAYVFGYRLALLVAGAGALYMAQFFSWTFAYSVMVALMGVGLVTTLLIREPAINHRRITEGMAAAIEQRVARRQHVAGWLMRAEAWFIVVVVGPFRDFFSRYGRYALWILFLVAVYRICDISAGVMANPFYLEFMGFTKVQVANVTKIFGFFMTIFGSGLGGVLVMRFGIRPILLTGAIATATANLMFVVIAQFPPNLVSLSLAVTLENLSGGLATVAFIAWLSSMTNAAFTATQYALFSSLMTLPGKIIGGFSGLIVENWGYPRFFVVSSILGIPAILLAFYMLRQGKALDALASPTHDQENLEESEEVRK